MFKKSKISETRQPGDCPNLDREPGGLMFGHSIKKGGRRGDPVFSSTRSRLTCDAEEGRFPQPEQLENFCTDHQCAQCPIHERVANVTEAVMASCDF